MKTRLAQLAVTLFILAAASAPAATLYVDANGTNATPPFTNWPTAATNIQDAIDAAAPGDTVLVTNGVYRTGGRAVSGVTNSYSGPYLPGTDPTTPGSNTNRVAVTKALTVQTVRGPAWTIIEGSSADHIRCVYLTEGATLRGFTLTNGFAGTGGGIWCLSTNALVSNCIIVSNQAAQGGGVFSGVVEDCLLLNNHAIYAGGGALASTVNNSVLTANFAGGGGGGSGGGAAYCVLNNCTVVSNLASAAGGGAESSALNNCIIYYNTGFLGSNYYSATLNYCCTTPLPSNGLANITDEPGFLNLTGGNLRLQTNSPCINSGNNAYVVNGTDLDGSPRIVGGTVDVGAYEFQTPISTISYAWLQQYGLPISANTDASDADGDLMNNWQEWRSGTNPTDALSILQMLSPTGYVSGVTVSWQSVSGVSYFLQRSSDLSTQPPFSTVQSNLVGQPNTTSYTDTSAIGAGPFFYRVGIQQ